MVMCMLVQEGANPTLKNRNGQSPFSACTSDITTVVRTFAEKRGSVIGMDYCSHVYYETGFLQ